MNEVQTHWVTCYLEPDHHECALARIDELATDNAILRDEVECQRIERGRQRERAERAEAELESARAERDDYQLLYREASEREVASMCEAASLRAEVAEVKTDAERYRWLRDRWLRECNAHRSDRTMYVIQNSCDDGIFCGKEVMFLETLDAVIDKARGEG